MFNKFKKGFYFEKYSTADEAKEELLKLHPIGSDVGELVKTLEGAGGVYNKMTSESLYFKETNKLISSKNLVFFGYIHRTLVSVYPREWRIFIEKEDDKILGLFVFYYQGE